MTHFQIARPAVPPIPGIRSERVLDGLGAGVEARALYANEAAIRHLTAALELLDELPADEPHLSQRWEVVFHLAKAFSDCRAWEQARAVLQEYLTAAGRAGYAWGVAAAHRWMHRQGPGL